MSSKKDWTEGLPELFENYSEATPEGLWDAVRAGVVPQKKRRAVPFWWYAAAAGLAAAAVAAVVLLWPASPTTPTIIATVPGNNDVLVDVPEPIVTTVHEDNYVPQALPSRRRAVTETPAVESVENPEEAGDSEEAGVPEEVVPGEVVPEEGASENGAREDGAPQEGAPEVVSPQDTDSTSPIVSASGPEPVVIPTRNRRTVKPRVQLALAFSPAMGKGVSTSATGVGLPSSAMTAMGTKATGAGANVMMLSRNKTSTTDASHRQGGGFSLGLRLDLDEHWGVETGIVSSSMASNYTTTVGNITSETSRTIGYMGIPLYGCYRLFEWKRLGLSLNAGPMYEFAVRTNTETSSYVSGCLTGEDSDRTKIDDDKWSMNVGASLQYRLLKHGALFVQPGLSYHFKDDSSVETLYTLQPTSFNLNFGYKFLF